VTVTCTGTPPKAACSGPASPVTVTQAAPFTVAISVTTMANALLIPQAPSCRLGTPWNRLPILWILPMLLMLLWRRCKQTEARVWVPRLEFAVPVLLLASVAAAVSGCGGGGTTAVSSGTPPGTYTLTVTVATSTNLTHAQQLTLIVQ
jgi:hypothetical protein